MLFSCLPSQTSVGKCWRLICHQQHSTTLFFLKHHHLWCPPMPHHHGHHHPQHNDNATMPLHQPNERRWGRHDMTSIITVWLFSATLVSRQPPCPPTAYYPGATSATMDTTMNSHLAPQWMDNVATRMMMRAHHHHAPTATSAQHQHTPDMARTGTGTRTTQHNVRQWGGCPTMPTLNDDTTLTWNEDMRQQHAARWQQHVRRRRRGPCPPCLLHPPSLHPPSLYLASSFYLTSNVLLK